MEDQTTDGYNLTKKWVLSATIVVVLGYAWLGARLSEPKLVFPEAVHNAVWVEKLRMRSLRSMSQFGPSQYLQWSSVFSQAKRLSNELSFLTPFNPRVDLLIDVDHRQAYSVSDHRIVIGLDIAASDGQLLKAFIKAWLFQKAAPAVQASQLRMEVASDVAVGMIRGHFKLGLPSGERLRLPPVENWLKHVSSFANSCDQVWLPFEIGDFCGTSDRLNPLMLRPLLTAMVLEAYQAIPPFQRLNFARQWLATLQDESTLAFRPPPEELVSWKRWVREEAQGFMRLSPGKMEEKIKEAGLSEESPLKVDFQLRMPDWRARTDVASKRLVAVVVGPRADSSAGFRDEFRDEFREETRLEPSGIPLSPADLEQIQAPVDVWAQCEAPSAREVLESSREMKSILYLPCEGRVELSGLSQGGVRIFARENRDTSFVYFNRSALALSLAKKILKPSVRLDSILRERHEPFSPLLGLDHPEWNAPMRAFRVLGAVEAVEWFRSAVRLPPSQRPPYPPQAFLQAP